LALSVVCQLPLRHLTYYPIAATATLYRWRHAFLTSRLDEFLRLGTRKKLRKNDPDLQSAIFRIMNEPPTIHGFHRTNWRQVDLHAALRKNGIRVSIWTIRRVIRANKYQWRHAKIVLTSNDPDYRAKVAHIKKILASLDDDEYFFSIDEYGPFTVRFMPGKKLCAPGEIPSAPQWQKSRGTLILIGALELKSSD
jgi:hypothetical protein